MFRIIEALLKTENSINAENPFEQCAHEHLENLCGTRAGRKNTLKQLDEVTVNFFEDQHNPSHIDNSIITRLISGEPISIQQKGDDNFVLIPYATLLFSVNEVIDFKEFGDQIFQRVVVIPFDATFIDTDIDKNKDTTTHFKRDIEIVDKLRKPKVLQIIATRAIQAFDKVLQNGKFTIPDIVQKETDKYFRECNSALDFCNLYPIDNFIGKSQYYVEYSTWCKENNIQPLGNSGFGKVVISFGYRSIRRSFDKKRNTYYVNPKFDTEKCYEFYYSFKKSKELKIPNYQMTNYIINTTNMSFEEYLGTYLYMEEQDKLAKQEEEQLKKLEPEILIDNTQ